MILRFQSQLREVERKINLENVHNEELMLELALNKSKGIGGVVGNSITATQPQTTNLGDSITTATMAPPSSVLTTTSNVFSTLTADITSLRKGKPVMTNKRCRKTNRLDL